MRPRAERRAQLARAKQKTREFLKHRLGWSPSRAADPRYVGIWTNTHRRPCSCDMCSPRKYEGARVKFKGLTLGAHPLEE